MSQSTMKGKEEFIGPMEMAEFAYQKDNPESKSGEPPSMIYEMAAKAWKLWHLREYIEELLSQKDKEKEEAYEVGYKEGQSSRAADWSCKLDEDEKAAFDEVRTEALRGYQEEVKDFLKKTDMNDLADANPIDAAKQYDEWSIKLHKSFGRLNFPRQ